MAADPFDLNGRVALVTAGLDGLGLEIANLLAAMGAHVVATTRDTSKADAFNHSGGEIVARALTFEQTTVERVVDDIVKEFGGLHLLVNSAAGRKPGQPVEDVTAESMAEEFDASVNSAFLCSRAVVSGHARTKIESIVNVGSIYGVLAVDHRIYEDPSRQTPLPYACAKAALVQMTRYLAAYWAPLGVRVNCVSPGGVRRAQTQEFLARYSARVPMGRMAEASEVAGAVSFLLSPAAGYITGENLAVDGGLHVW